jgi:hypothetical protein
MRAGATAVARACSRHSRSCLESAARHARPIRPPRCPDSRRLSCKEPQHFSSLMGGGGPPGTLSRKSATTAVCCRILPQNPQTSCKRTRRTPLPHDEAADGSPRSSPAASPPSWPSASSPRARSCSGATPRPTTRATSRPARTATPRAPTPWPPTISTSTSTERDGSWTATTSATFRLSVESTAGKPVFVGIAHTSDVSDYLRGTPYTSVTDVDYAPFHASYRDRDNGGDRGPALPAD